MICRAKVQAELRTKSVDEKAKKTSKLAIRRSVSTAPKASKANKFGGLRGSHHPSPFIGQRSSGPRPTRTDGLRHASGRCIICPAPSPHGCPRLTVPRLYSGRWAGRCVLVAALRTPLNGICIPPLRELDRDPLRLKFVMSTSMLIPRGGGECFPGSTACIWPGPAPGLSPSNAPRADPSRASAQPLWSKRVIHSYHSA